MLRNKVFNIIKLIIFSIILILLNILLIEKNENFEGIDFNSLVYKLNIIPFVICAAILIFINLDKIKIEYVFLFLGLVIGILYIIVMPIGAAPDELAHWYKSYEISLGNLFSDKSEENYGGRVMNSKLQYVLTTDHVSGSTDDTYEEWKARYDNSLGYEDQEEFIEFSNTAIYSPVAYIPQSLGICISRIFTSSLLVQSYAARLFNFGTYMLVMWYAIKKIPFKKIAVIAIAFLPITMQEVTSMSIDGLVIAFSTLLVSYTLFLTFDKNTEKMKIKDYVILIISSIFVAITKIVYLPICLIMYIIPKEKFKSNKRKIIILTVIILIVTILDGLVILNSLNYKNRVASFDADTVGQIINVLQDPIGFIKVMINTFYENGVNDMLGLFGEGLSWYDVEISPIYILLAMIFILYNIYPTNVENMDNISTNVDINKDKEAKDNENQNENKILDIDKEDKKRKIISYIFGILFFILIFAIVFTEYATINAVDADAIAGLQSRYYIPCLILMIFAFKNNLKKNNKQNFIYNKYVLIFMLSLNLNALTCIMSKYWQK